MFSLWHFSLVVTHTTILQHVTEILMYFLYVCYQFFADVCLNVNINDVNRGHYKNARFVKHQGHTEWARQGKLKETRSPEENSEHAIKLLNEWKLQATKQQSSYDQKKTCRMTDVHLSVSINMTVVRNG